MTKAKNVLFISYDGITDPLGQSQILPYLLGLSKHGFKIFLLSCEKSEPFSRNKEIIDNLIKDSGIVWQPLSYTKNPPVVSSWLDVLKIKRAAKKIHKKHGLDMVHTRAGVPAIIGLWLKKKFGIKFLNDVRDFYADSRVDGGMWNLKNPLYKTVHSYFKRQEEEQYKFNDGIVCLTHAAKSVITALPQYKKEIPLEIVPCSADIELFNRAKISDEQIAAVKADFGIKPDDIIITYLGSVGGLYLTEEMMHFCKTVSDKIPAAKFLFISPIRHAEIAAAASGYGIPAEKLIIKKAARKEVPLFLSVSNFSMFLIKPCFSRKAQSPTKHGELMAMGIPVITNQGIGDVEEIIKRYQSGMVIKSFSEAEYARVADEILAGKSYNTAAIRKGAEEYYALSSAIEKYNRIYNSILQ